MEEILYTFISLPFAGNYCPVCKKCYDDDDYDCEMVECSSCQKWIHATCENLTSKSHTNCTQQRNVNFSFFNFAMSCVTF